MCLCERCGQQQQILNIFIPQSLSWVFWIWNCTSSPSSVVLCQTTTSIRHCHRNDDGGGDGSDAVDRFNVFFVLGITTRRRRQYTHILLCACTVQYSRNAKALTLPRSSAVYTPFCERHFYCCHSIRRWWTVVVCEFCDDHPNSQHTIKQWLMYVRIYTHTQSVHVFKLYVPVLCAYRDISSSSLLFTAKLDLARQTKVRKTNKIIVIIIINLLPFYPVEFACACHQKEANGLGLVLCVCVCVCLILEFFLYCFLPLPWPFGSRAR